MYEAFYLGLNHYNRLRRFWSTCGPMTMAHGDAHMGNVFVSGDYIKAGFIDFQCVSVEHFMRDVSYHLINSCPAEDLKDIEEPMMRWYLQQLEASFRAQGKEQYIEEIPSYERAYFLYRGHALWSLFAWIICCGFSGVVMVDFAVCSLQRGLDTGHRLNILGAVKQSLEEEVSSA